MLPTINKDIPYVIHEHKVGSSIDYQISFQTMEDELQFVKFPRTGNMATLSNAPNVGRYFGTLSDETRAEGWLEFEGITKMAEGVTLEEDEEIPVPGEYNIIDSGIMRVGEQTAKFSELFFKGNLLTDRWILRRIPNIFEKSFLGEEKEVLLFWKPSRQKDFTQAFSKNAAYIEKSCACPVADASLKFHDLTKNEGVEKISKMQGAAFFNNETKTFEGIAAAVGTWIDMYGDKYTYTPEFVTFLYNQERDGVSKNQGTPLSPLHSMDKEFTDEVTGKVTNVRLVQDPIKHIVVNGVYDGPAESLLGKVGLSYELKLRSSWNEDFQSWIPFDATIGRLSVVRRPACTICWINKVN